MFSLSSPQQAAAAVPPPFTAEPAKPFTGSGKRVLVVEDDEVLSRFLERLLRNEGYTVRLAASGQSALELSLADFDLVLLDLNLPDVDGLSVLRHYRHQDCHPPVLVLTGRSRAESAVPALENGADDCLTKPFSYLELLARLRALLRRQGDAGRGGESPLGALVLHREQMMVSRSGKRLDLTPREFALLEFLMRTPGVPVARSILLRELWGEQCSTNSNVVDVYMKYVRDKVDLPGQPKLVHTVRGVGYVLRAD